ncbi:MAG: 2'-5' RNA ligase family protein [Candidatus Eisenbacteria bacterium]
MSDRFAAMIRRQLTLFVPPDAAIALEILRRTLDPVQAALIGAHVTLAREDEIAGLDAAALAARVAAAASAPIALEFGAPVAFGGHGWLLECVRGQDAFDALRTRLLGERAARVQHAHLTLAHPRNVRDPGNTAAAAARWPAGFVCTFGEAAWIEQEGGAAWRVLRTFALAGTPA